MPRKRIRNESGPNLPRAQLPKGAVKSAARILQILELLDDFRCPLNAAQIIEELELPQASAAALLRTMVSLGYLHMNPAGRTFEPTARIVLLGSWQAGRLHNAGPLTRMMDRLAAATGESIMLATRSAHFVRYIHFVPAARLQRYRLPRGSLAHLTETTSGVTLLSLSSNADIRKMVTWINARKPDHEARTSADDIIERVERIRAQGYAFNEGSVNPETISFTVILPFKDGDSPLALTIATERGRREWGAGELLQLVDRELRELMQADAWLDRRGN